MGKTVLLCGAVLFFTACHHTTQQKPDADRVIKDTLAQIILRPFNEAPDAHPIYVYVEAQETHFLCARNAAISQLEEDIKNPPQRYLVNPGASNNLDALNGTRISLQPDCFIDKKGKVVTSPVEISVKECYRPGELLMENIATANDNGAIEAKGAVFIRASVAGEDLSLKESKSINVSVPISSEANTYQLFYGKQDTTGELTWTADLRQNNSYDIITDKQFIKPAFAVNGLGLADYLHEVIKYSDDAKINELSQKVTVSFVVDENGKVGDVSTNECYKTFKTGILQVLANMPAWEPASFNGTNVPTILHLDIDFNLHRADQVQIDFKENEITLLKPGTDLTENAAEKKDNRASFLSSHLGWLAIGRSIDVKGEKAEVIVPDDAGCNVKLVMQKQNIIAGGENCVGYTRFKSLQIGSKVFVVATKKEGSQTYYAIQPVKLKKQNIVALAWKKAEEPEIRKALLAI
jgi:hypothetical protein